jgi:hypothetical protein
MTNDTIIRIFQQQPFIPFSIITVDGRQLDVKHPEQAMFGVRGETVLYFYPNHRLEIIESRLIVSVRTLLEAEFETYGNN